MFGVYCSNGITAWCFITIGSCEKNDTLKFEDIKIYYMIGRKTSFNYYEKILITEH